MWKKITFIKVYLIKRVCLRMILNLSYALQSVINF